MTTYELKTFYAQPRLIAVARATVSQKELVPKMLGLIGVTWDFLRTSGLKGGHNIALYTPGTDSLITVEAGAGIGKQFEGNGTVFCSATPEGMVATSRHVGPYDQLGVAHQAIGEWSKSNNRKLAGPNWEIYSHETGDPSKAWVDVYYLLQS